MKPFYRVLHCDGSQVSHKIESRSEAQKFAEVASEGDGGAGYEIALVVGIAMRPKASTFWCDGCVDTSEPGG
jgi:hypothetical protein